MISTILTYSALAKQQAQDKKIQVHEKTKNQVNKKNLF